MEANGMTTAKEMREKLGPPPPEVGERVPASRRLPLPRAAEDGFDALLARRTTCRNFDTGRALSLALLARLMQRVFAARAAVAIQDDAVFLKKNAPPAAACTPRRPTCWRATWKGWPRGCTTTIRWITRSNRCPLRTSRWVRCRNACWPASTGLPMLRRRWCWRRAMRAASGNTATTPRPIAR
jgi:hypothetical protein